MLLIFSLIILLALWRSVLWQPRSLSIPQKNIYLIGHRGVRGSLPENTLAAFKKAFDSGLDGIEFDVQKSRDGALVIYHDFNVEDGRALKDLSLAELRHLQPDMPTLEELFTLAKQYPHTILNLEIKTRAWQTQGLERLVINAVNTSGLAARILISSFNPLSLARVRLRAPKLYTALLFSPDMAPLLRSAQLAGWLHVDALHPHFSQVDEAFMQKAKNIKVNTWTVNEGLEVARLYKLGVNAIMADDPSALKDALIKAQSYTQSP